MRVWVISSSYPTSPRESVNAGVLARDLALDLSRRGHEVVVLTPAKPASVIFDSELTGVTFSWYQPTREISDLGSTPRDLLRAATLMLSGFRTVARLGRSRRPDVLIALWGLPSGLLARIGARSVNGAYGVWLLGSDVWRAKELPLGRRLLKMVCRDAMAVAADGLSLAEEATRLTGVPVDYLPSSRRLPASGQVAFSPTDLVFIGRYHRNKGPDLLLEAMLADGAANGMSAALYGAGDLEGTLREKARGLDNVAVNGPIEAAHIRARLRSCRALVIPSRIESVPLILGDAIQSRCRVVVSDVGDMAEIVRGFRIGTVANADDPVSLANAIRSLVESPTKPDWEAAADFLGPDRPADYFLGRLTQTVNRTEEQGGPSR